MFLSTMYRVDSCAVVLWDFVCLLFLKDISPSSPSCLILLQSRNYFCHWCLLAIMFLHIVPPLSLYSPIHSLHL